MTIIQWETRGRGESAKYVGNEGIWTIRRRPDGGYNLFRGVHVFSTAATIAEAKRIAEQA